MPVRRCFAHFLSAALALPLFAWMPNGEAQQPLPENPPTITIGLIDTFAPEFYLRTYVPTIEYLKKKLPAYRFNIREIDHRAIRNSIAVEKPDFLVSSASQFVSLIDTEGAQQIVTKKRAMSDDVQHSVASAFVVRSDRDDIRTVADLRNKSIAATDDQDFDGWLIALYSIASQGFDPEKFFSRTVFSRYHYPSVVTMVKAGQTDAGVLSTCQLEAAIASGAIGPHDLKVLNAPPRPEFCIRSTARFPDVVFSSLPRVSPTTVKDVTMALLSMPAAQNDFEWIPASGFLETFDLMKTLRMGPYAHLRTPTVEAFLSEHRQDLYFLSVLILAVLIHIVRVNVLVRRRTQELVVAEQERNRAQSAALQNRKKLEVLEKSQAISQMSSLFAHEVKQPITNMLYYASGIRMLLKQHGIEAPQIETALDKLSREARRTAEIVDHVRGYARRQPKELKRCDLWQIAHQAVHSLHAEERYGDVLQMTGEEGAWVMVDAFEIELVILNLVKNALTAAKNEAVPHVELRLTSTVSQWVMTVTDNGPVLDEAVFARLGTPQKSSKHDGLGIGLSIAHNIIEGYGGHLTFARRQPSGLECAFTLPKLTQETPS